MSFKVSFNETPDYKAFKIILWALGILFVVAMVIAALQAVGTIDINTGDLSYHQWLQRHNQTYQEYLKYQEHQNLIGQVFMLVFLPFAYAFFYWIICIHYPAQFSKCPHGHIMAKRKDTKYCRTCGVKLNTEEPLA